MNCKCCGEDKKLIKAHIIPKSFYRNAIGDSDKPLTIVTDTKGIRPKRSQEGEYDKEILCHGCEQLFQECDNYAQELFLKTKFEETIIHPDLSAYELTTYNYNLLKRFCLSVTYRAHLSNRGMFKHISLGKYAPLLKDLLHRKDSIGFNTFPCVIYHHSGDYSLVMPDPCMTRMEGVNWGDFYLGSFGFLIKLDQRPVNHRLSKMVLREDTPLVVSSSPFKKSKHFKVLNKIFPLRNR